MGAILIISRSVGAESPSFYSWVFGQAEKIGTEHSTSTCVTFCILSSRNKASSYAAWDEMRYESFLSGIIISSFQLISRMYSIFQTVAHERASDKYLDGE